MIRKFFSKFLYHTGIGRGPRGSRKLIRRIAIEPLETRRLLAVTGSISGYAYLDPAAVGGMKSGDAGFAGLTVGLKSVDSQGNLSSVSGAGPVQTKSDGSYTFTGLAAGTYQVQILPSAKLAVGTLSPGSAGGTAGNNEIQLQLAANQNATDYNFAILGAQTSFISLRMFLASTGTLSDYLTTLHAAPAVQMGTTSSSAYSTTYTTGGPAVAVVSLSATILSTDSPTLTSMTVTIENPLNGNSEQLSATTTGTTLTSNYSSGVLSVSGVADIATYQTVLRSVTYKITSSPASNGARTISVAVDDGTATSTAATSTITVVQGTGPSGYSITADKARIGASAAASTGFTFSNALSGTTYNYTISSSGSNATISGSGSVTSSSQDITGINVSSLADGTLTYSVTLTDSSSQSGTAATATATLDKTTPTGYSITPDRSAIGAATMGSTGFTFSGAEVGSTYNYSIASGGGGTALSGSGTVSSATQDVSGINVTSLSDGNLTFSVTLTDAAGNVGSAATATATLDRIAPTGYSITADSSLINATASTSTGFTFAGATTGTTYKYTVSSSGGSTTATGSGSVTSVTQDITGINVSTLPSGTLTYSVTLTDSAGNVGTAATATATLDKTAPSGYAITPTKSALNATAAAADSFSFTGAELNATYNYTIASTGGGTPVAGSGTITSATQTISGIDVSALSDGNLTYSVTLTDAGGNVGTAATASGTLDRVAPSGYTIAANQATINIAAKANTGFVFSNAETGDIYNYMVTGSNGGSLVSGSGTVTSATQVISGVDVSGLHDGTLTFTVILADPAGNVGTAVTATATLNTVAPTGYTITTSKNLINASQAASADFTFVSAEVGDTYNFAVTSGSATPVTGSGSVTSAGQQIAGIDVTGLPDGTLTFSVTLTNAVGNTGAAATVTATLDKTAPNNYAIAPVIAALNAAAATADAIHFTGAELNATFNYTISSSGGGTPVTGSGTITSATQAISGIDVSLLADGNLTYSVTLTDPAGNVGVAATASGTLDRTAPSGYTITAKQATVNIAASHNTGFVLSNAELDDTYNYTVTGAGGGSAVTGSGKVTSATQTISDANVSAYSDGTLTFSVTLTDPAGNEGTAVTATATLDTVAPTGYTITTSRNLINASQAASVDFTFVSAEVGDTYNFAVTSGSATPVTGSGSVTSAGQPVAGIDVTGLPDGTLTFSVTLTNAVGNTGAAATATATLDKTAPNNYAIGPVNAALNAAAATADAIHFTGAELNATYNYTISSSGGGTPVTGSGTITSATETISGIDVSALSDGNLTYSVTLTDPAGNVSTAATAGGTLDRTAPSGYTITAKQALVNIAASTNTGFVFDSAELDDTYNYTVTSSGGAATLSGSGTVTSATQVVSGANVSALSDGTLTFSVTLTDLAGNVGPAATASATLDRTAPGGYTIAANQATVNIAASHNTGFVFSNAELGDNYNFTVTSSGGGSPVSGSGTVTSATQTVSGANVSTLLGGTLTFSVTLTDPAGNVGTAATATATLNTVAPTGYTITTAQSLINASQAASVSFTFISAEVGDTYNYTVTSGNATPVTGSGSVTAAGQQITGIDVAGLPDGTLTFSVTLTNGVGNTGIAATVSATLDKTAPSGHSITPNYSIYGLAQANIAGFNFSGAEVGDAYNYTINSSGVDSTPITGSGTVTSATQTVGGDIDFKPLKDGTVTFSVTLTDAAGNTGGAATATATLDRVAPTFTVTPDLPAYDSTNDTNVGFTLGDAEVGDTYSYGFILAGMPANIHGGGTVTASNMHVGGINISALPSGNYLLHVILTDAATNGAAVNTPVTLTNPIPAFTITANPSKISASAATNTSFTFAGATTNTTYRYTVASSGGAGSASGSGTVASATQTVTGIDVSGLPDGTLTYSVTLTSASNIVSTPVTATATLAKRVPSGYTITADVALIASNSAAATTGFTFAAATPGDTYSYTVTSSGGAGSVTGGGSVTSATQDVTPIDVSALPDGRLTYSVTLTSPQGNVGVAATATATLDVAAPSGFTVTPDHAVINAGGIGSAGFTLAAAKVGATYSYSVSDGASTPVTGSGSVTAVTQDITGIDLSSLATGTVTFSVTLTSPAGHVSNPAAATATIDLTVPAAIAISTSVAPDGQSPGSLVGVLQTVGPQSTASYTYSLVTGAGSADNASFQINGDELQTNAIFDSTVKSTYEIRLRSTDAQGQSIEQPLVITVSASDPIAATLSLSNASIAGNQPAGMAVGSLSFGAAVTGSTVHYSFVSGTGIDNNSSFQIVGNQLQTAEVVSPGTYTVRIRCTSTFLLSDVVDLGNVNGPYAFQVSFDPSQLPSGAFRQAAEAAGLIALGSDATGKWYPAIAVNKEVAGSLAQPNFQGSYAAFWNSVTAAHPSATLQDVVGSSGVDAAANAAWAVVDHPGEYAVAAQVFTEKVFTITVT
jgi:large repetitive protein